MTLVVGKILSDGKVLIKSDSKITDHNAVKNDPLCGVLKTLVLHPHISLSFAGKIFFAEKAIRLFFERKINHTAELLSLLLEIHQESNNQTDFVVSTLLNGIPVFYKISNFKIEESRSNFWIGDIDAFNVYQRVYHQQIGVGSDEPTSMKLAFKSVVDNPDISSVDHFMIELSSNKDISPGDNVFLYELKLEVNSGFHKVHVPANTKMALTVGGPETGSYSISHFITVSPQFHGVGVFFEFGRFGVFFCPQIKTFEPIIIRDVNGSEFADQLLTTYGIPVQGLVIEKGSQFKFIDTRTKS